MWRQHILRICRKLRNLRNHCVVFLLLGSLLPTEYPLFANMWRQHILRICRKLRNLRNHCVVFLLLGSLLPTEYPLFAFSPEGDSSIFCLSRNWRNLSQDFAKKHVCRQHLSSIALSLVCETTAFY